MEGGQAIVHTRGRDTARTTSCDIFVPGLPFIDDMERPPQTLGREVDVPLSAQGRRGHPEHLLGFNPFNEVQGDRVIKLNHGKGRRESDAHPERGTYIYRRAFRSLTRVMQLGPPS